MNLETGKIYHDKVNNEDVEFRYMGVGHAIVCEPGDSGGGMQSCWGVPVDNLIDLAEEGTHGNISFIEHREMTAKDCETAAAIITNVAAKVRMGNFHAFEDFWAMEDEEGQTCFSVRENIILRYLFRKEKLEDTI